MQDNWPMLVDGCLRRDRDAQRQLYERHFAFAMSVAIRYCDSREEAMAVLQDAYLTVFRRLHKYDVTMPFRPWFRTIVVRAALDMLRDKKKTAYTLELHDDTLAFERENILSRIGYEELLAMVRRLSAGYRAVFNLYAIDGFKHHEIAAQLGISVGTSKSNLFKARAHLQRMVEQSLATPLQAPVS